MIASAIMPVGLAKGKKVGEAAHIGQNVVYYALEVQPDEIAHWSK